MSKRTKEKIEVGQCYRWDDHVYMVLHISTDSFSCRTWVGVENTLTKEHGRVDALFLEKQERPFQNFG